MGGQIYPLIMEPGIQRDGTSFSTRKWSDGQWVRFYRGNPRKMGGYTRLLGGLPNIVRGTIIIPTAPNFNIYIADRNSVKYFPISQVGLPLGPLVDRTPVLFQDSQYNDWKFDTMYSTVNNSGILVGHAAPNLFSIDSNIETPIYYGDSLANTALIPTGISVSGGILAVHPFLMMYGNDGEVFFSNANDPTTIMNFVPGSGSRGARVAGTKIVAAVTTRGGSNAPAALLWSLDSLIRMTNVGTNQVEFEFDTITSEVSIISNKSIIEMDNVYYWCGIDKFYYYQGVVNELPNDTNLRYFFDNLNFSQRQKVWATKVAKEGEIWWHYPSGTNTECDRTVIFSVREKKWLDTKIRRSIGDFDATFQFPIWCDTNATLTPPYNVWMHETGTTQEVGGVTVATGFDQNVNGVLTAIDSHIQSSDIALCAVGPDGKFTGVDRWVELYRVEPDFIQAGNMSLTVSGRKYARSPSVDSAPFVFTQTTEKIDMREQRREMSLLFECNDLGGFFEMGNVLLLMRVGDGRQ